MKRPKIKLVDKIFRWDDVSYERGVVLKIETKKKKKYVTIEFPNGSIRRNREEIKWQKRYLHDTKQWTTFRWVAPAKITMEVPVKKIEGAWVKTYQAGELVSMKLTEESYKQMGQKPKQQKKS